MFDLSSSDSQVGLKDSEGYEIIAFNLSILNFTLWKYDINDFKSINCNNIVFYMKSSLYHNTVCLLGSRLFCNSFKFSWKILESCS